jgi:RNA polymerase sigma-70 factor (ECF subfamily)
MVARVNAGVVQDSGAVALVGDTFESLYRAHYAEIFGFCQRRLRDPERAADAAQQTFFLAYRGFGSYQERGTPRAWLFQIARNVVIDSSRGHPQAADLDSAASVPDPSRSPEDEAVSAFDLLRVRQAIARLPDDPQTALELRSFGLSFAEIGDVLHRSEDAAKQLWYRSIKRLQRDLGLEGGSHVA